MYNDADSPAGRPLPHRRFKGRFRKGPPLHHISASTTRLHTSCAAVPSPKLAHGRANLPRCHSRVFELRPYALSTVVILLDNYIYRYIFKIKNK